MHDDRDDTGKRPGGQARGEPTGAPETGGAAVSPRDTATGQVRPTDGPMERAGTEAEARERGETGSVEADRKG